MGGAFASRYVAEILLAEALSPEVIIAYARRATVQKYLHQSGQGT